MAVHPDRPAISVIIPVMDGGDRLRDCLAGITRQDVGGGVEVVIVDSGSRDGSREIAVAHGARVVRIPVAEFDHGATRNLGVRKATGETVVFTTQDAHAEDSGWLRRLVAPLDEGPSVAAAYGRQLPHPDAHPAERYFLEFLYGSERRVQRAASVADLSMATTIFSNVNAAFRRETLLREPFAEDIIMSEDQEWVRRMLLTGCCVVYEPLAAVRHSHSYSLRKAFTRFFDSGVSAERTYLAGQGAADAELRRSALRYATGEIRWLWQHHLLRSLPSVVVLELAKFAGLQLGKRHRFLPLALKRRFSGLPNHWTRASPPRLQDGRLRRAARMAARRAR